MMDFFKRFKTKENQRYVKSVLGKLDDDPYKADILGMIERSEANPWVTLGYLAKVAKPKRYLEVGVRRGFSLAIVASRCKTAHLVGIDLWIPNYAGVANPGPDFVREQIALTGHKGELDLVSGNSHQVLPTLTDQFDLIFLDGDHTAEGVYQDVITGLNRLLPGGYLIVDDLHDDGARAGWQRVIDERQPVHYVEGRVGVAIGG